MRTFRRLLPYAATGALVVVLTSAAMVLTLRDVQLGERGGSAIRTPTPARPGAELSAAGRLAWWRADPSGGTQLWAANLDGTLRRPIAQADVARDVAKTRWLPDGSGVAWIEGGTRLVVVTLAGGRRELALSDALVAEGRRIADQRWSPSAAKVAVTVARAGDGRSDVWIARADRGGWVRATDLEDAIAGPWLDEEELLLSTTSGLVAALRDGALDAVRPLTGLAGGSPLVADDGRVWLLAGRVGPGSTDADPAALVSDATAWSMWRDGGDPRAEQRVGGVDSLRLDGRWPDGRLVVHRGNAPGASLVGSGAGPTSLSNASGVVDRVAVAADQKSAIAFTSTRVLKLDLTKTPPASTVLLDGVGDADAWFPASARAAAAPAVAPAAPLPRTAFSLAGGIYAADASGTARLVRATPAFGGPRRIPLPLPLWSPRDDLLLVLEPAAGAQGTAGLTALTIDGAGAVTRLAALGTLARATPAWSPDGATLAAVGPAAAGAPDDLEVRFVAPGGGPAGPSLPGREIAWTSAGLVVLGNGTVDATRRLRTGQTIDLVNGTTRRTLTSGDALVTGAGAPATGLTARQVSGLAATAGGTWLSVGLTWATQSQNRAVLALVRAADGKVTYVTQEVAGDVAWSPASPVVAFTSSESRRQGNATIRVPIALVVDAATGATLQKVDGRFAGWLPDGSALLVARESGLYRQAAGTAEPVRVGPIGVPMAVKAP